MLRVSRCAPLLVLCLGGCMLFEKGQTHAEFEQKTNILVMTVASQDGQYALYVDNDPVPSVVVSVKKGQPMGFDRTEEGRIRAVAGTFSTQLPKTAATARWAPREEQGS